MLIEGLETLGGENMNGFQIALSRRSFPSSPFSTTRTFHEELNLFLNKDSGHLCPQCIHLIPAHPPIPNVDIVDI